VKQFTPQELHEYLQQTAEKPLLLDVREPWEYDICHLPGSELVPMGSIPQAIDELDHDRETVVICHHGIRSRQVCYYLEHMGFDKVINLGGGIDAWAKDIDSSLDTY
jgi:rhodanese-related sulfurtransferase